MPLITNCPKQSHFPLKVNVFTVQDAEFAHDFTLNAHIVFQTLGVYANVIVWSIT